MMLNTLVVLTRARFQMARNTVWRGGLGRKLSALTMLAFLVLIATAAYNIARLIVRGLRSTDFADLLTEAAAQSPGLPTDFAPYLAAAPSAILFGTLLMLVLSSVSSLLNALYLAKDIDTLLVAPIPLSTIFTLKFFNGLQVQYVLLVVLVMPILIGYGHGMDYGTGYLFSVLYIVLLFPLVPVGLGAILVMAVVRVLPAERARDLIAVLGGLVGVSFYVTSQLAARPDTTVLTPDNLNILLASNIPWLPSAWAARTLVAVGEGQLPVALFYGSLFTGFTLVTFAACLLIAERLYFIGWSNLADQPQRARQRNGTRTLFGAFERVFRSIPGFPLQAQAVLLKDLRLFTRDLYNLQLLIFPLAMAGIWIFQLLGGPSANNSPGNAEVAEQLRSIGSMGIVFFICLSLSSALASGSISREGRAYWILQVAPISAGRIFLGKLMLAYLPYPILGTPLLLLIGILARTPPILGLQQWLLVLIAGVGCTAITLGLGATFPRMNWENPNQQRAWQVGCLSAVLYPIYLGMAFGVVFGGIFAAELLGGGLVGTLFISGSWLLSILITVSVTWAATGLGIRGIRRIEG